jgi:hypothetical protein
MEKEKVCYYVAIHIGEPDWPEPICIGKTIQEVIELLDEWCGYPENGNTRSEFITHNPKYPSPYEGSITYHNPATGMLEAWDDKFQIYSVCNYI